MNWVGFSYANRNDPHECSLHFISQRLNGLIRDRARGDEKQLRDLILGVEFTYDKKSIYGYRIEESKLFLKVFTATPSLVPGTKRVFEDGFDLPSYGRTRCQTYESNIPFILRFMVDNDISGEE